MRIAKILTLTVALSALLLAGKAFGQTDSPSDNEEAKLQCGGPPPHEGLPPPPPPHGGPMGYDFMRRAVEMSFTEDERNNLRRMAFERPEEFRSELSKRFQSIRQKRQEEQAKISELQKAYNEAPNAEAKQKALNDLKELVKVQFDQKMELNRKRIAETEKNLKDAQERLAEYKKKYEERKAKAEGIMAERVRELTKDPDLNW